MAFSGFGERLALLIDANASGAIRELKRVGDTSEAQFAKAKTSQEKWSHGLIVGGAAAVGFAAVVGKGLFSAAKAYGESERASLKLENTMAHQPKLAGASTDAFDKLAHQIDQTTRVTHVQVTASEALLGQFGLTQDQILKLTPLIVDLSVKMGIDLNTATRAVGRAVLGTGAGLSRMGIVLDKTALKADGFGTVVAGLSSKVGGFAKTDGKTFEGQLAILHNQFKDLEEGVGKGATEQLAAMLKSVNSLAGGFGHLNSDSQATVGRFATIGTTGLAAAGSVALLAGAAIKAKAALTTTEAGAGVLGTRLTGVGAASVGVGVAVVGLGLAYEALSAHSRSVASATEHLTQVMQVENKTAKEAAQSILVEWLSKHREEARVLREAGVSVKTYFDAVTGNKNALTDVNTKLDAYIKLTGEGKTSLSNWSHSTAVAAGNVSHLKDNLDIQNGSLREQRNAAKEAARTARELASGTKDAGKAAKDTAGEIHHLDFSADLAAKSIASLRTEEERLANKAFDVRDATRAFESAQLDVANATVAVTQAEKDLATARAGGNAATIAQAERDLAKALIDTSQSTDDAARATQDLAAKQIGATDVVDALKNHHDDYLRALGALSATLRGPVKAALDAYIAQLGGIPPAKHTDVTVAVHGQESLAQLRKDLAALGSQTPISVVVRAEGGRVPGKTALGGVFTSPQVREIAEAGPEAVVPLSNPRRAAQVLDQAGLIGAAPSGGQSLTINVNVDARGAVGLNDRALEGVVIDAISRHHRKGGTWPFKVAS